MISISQLVRWRASARVAIVMLFLGGVILVWSYDFLREWSALRPALAIVTAIWVFTGVIATGCALRLLNSHRDARPLWCGAVAAVIAGLSLGVGVLTHIVPCAGPICVVSRLTAAGGVVVFGVIAPRVIAR